MLVPWVPPPPPEVEVLPGGIPVTEFATQISEWKAGGMSGQDVVNAARNKWGLYHDDDLPRLRLAVSLVGATHQTHSFQLLEAIQTRLLVDTNSGQLNPGFGALSSKSMKCKHYIISLFSPFLFLF